MISATWIVHVKLVAAQEWMLANSLPRFGPSYHTTAEFEPFGAEDRGASDNIPSIPEPLVFDLVRGLGAEQGEFEFNTLAIFPLNGGDRDAPEDFDPFGLDPGSQDRDGIEWAPEIEFAVVDGLAFEFELPLEGSRLEAYKFATQLTIGTACEDRFIHGIQTIVEPDVHFDVWDVTLLYLAGLQVDRTWSALGMVGVRPQIEEGNGTNHLDGILNVTLFADLTDHLTVGLEHNFTFGESDRTSLLVMPQVDYEITDNSQIQAGLGPGFSVKGTETFAVLRLIWSR